MNFKFSRPQLKKSQRCKKLLWLSKNRPDLKISTQDRRQRLNDAKAEILDLAKRFFPEGKTVNSKTYDHQALLDKTKSFIENGTQTIFDGLFSNNGIYARVDIIKKVDNGYIIYEIKGSTRLRESHTYDIAFLYNILSALGLNICKIKILYLNPYYTYCDELNINKLFQISDVTDEVIEKQEKLNNDIESVKSILESECPNVDIGQYCLKPHDCEFIPFCWEHIPKNSIFDLRGSGIDKFEYYKKGIIHLKDIDLKDLNERQLIQADAELNNKKYMNIDKIKEFLDQVTYPLYFLDFETFQTPVPKLNKTKAYEQIPFQYSVHYKESKDAELQHFEFLANGTDDPREDLSKNLVSHIKQEGCVLVYNMVFEKSVINKLASQYPIYKKHLLSIVSNIFDLMEIFKRRDYYTKEMKGSYSLKYVLPAIVPDLQYNDLNISNGEEAMSSYIKLSDMTEKEEINKIREGLLEYCKLDTFALFKLLEELESYF